MKHTGLPWRMCKRASGMVESEQGRSVAACMGYTTNTDNGAHIEENLANAAFIVRAVNCHEQLVEALEETLREAIGWIDDSRGFSEEDLIDSDSLPWITRARTALTAAKEES